MHILAFDTCFDACSVCVAQRRSGGIAELASVLERFDTGHAERLVPMIDEVMGSAGVTFEDLDRIAVTIGPGTFTGTRIGIAAARGLSLTTGVAAIGVSSLAVMAGVAVRDLGFDAGVRNVAVAVDARRGEVYAQLFAGDGEALLPPMLLSIEDAARLGGSAPLLVVGSGAEAVAAAAAAAGRKAEPYLASLLPDAAVLARLSVDRSPAEAPLAPLYLRPPDAKPQDGKSIARARQ